MSNPAGAPPLDWWSISPAGYTGAHYAVYPPELCRIPIDSMCPRQVCTICGDPRRRITETTPVPGRVRRVGPAAASETRRAGGDYGNPDKERWETTSVETTGWTDCGHDSWRRGIVLDPFAGSGTTLLVAVGMGRDAIGIDLDERNADLARDRVGMFLDVEQHQEVAA